MAADSYQLYRDFIEAYPQAEFKFSQITRTTENQTYEAAGNMYYSRPSRFWIEYTKPDPFTVVSNGEKLWYYDKALNQVQILQLEDNWLAQGLVALFANSDPESIFTFSQPAGADPDYEWLLVIPHSTEHSQFEELRMAFALDGVPAKIQITDLFGNIVSADFSSLLVSDYGDDDFIFNPPPGVDIYDQQ